MLDINHVSAAVQQAQAARDSLYAAWGIRPELLDQAHRLDADLAEAYRRSDLVAGHNQLKVLKAFQDVRVSEAE